MSSRWPDGRAPESTISKSDHAPTRNPVFSRLGPVPPPSQGYAHEPPIKPSARGNSGRTHFPPKSFKNSNDDVDSSYIYSENPLPPSRGKSSGPLHSNDGRRRSSIQPNALLHRSLRDIKKERDSEVMANPFTAVEELQAQVDRAQADQKAAEELADALLLSQQTLLQEKTKLQAENERLVREVAMMRELLEYSQAAVSTGGGGGGGTGRNLYNSPLNRLATHAHHHTSGVIDDGELPITPDSEMLRVLREAKLIDDDAGDADGSGPGNFLERLESENS